MDVYRRARLLLTRAEQREDLVAIDTSIANALRLSGEKAAGWSRVAATLPDLRHVRTARRRHTVLLNASLFAQDDNLIRAALLFLDESIEAAYARGGINNSIVEGLVRRARLNLRVSDSLAARRDLARATALLPALPSQSLQAYVEGWLDIVEGEASGADDVDRATAALLRARKEFEAAEPGEVPSVDLTLARIELSQGRIDGAEARLRMGVSAFESRWRLLGWDESRAMYLDTAWELFAELIRLAADDRNNPEAALAWGMVG